MASDSDCSGSSSSDEETLPVLKKRKYKSMVYSSSDSDDVNSDVERKPKSKRKPKPLCESDSEVAENSTVISPNDASCSSNSGEYACGGPDDIIPENEKKASIESSDSDEQSEKCPICLSKFNGQDIGTPESCDHSFCLDCLQEWAKKVNTCPVDRLLFNLILVRRHPEGKIIGRICVENKEFIDEDEEDTDSSFYDTYCEVCGENDNEERLLLCDDCDLAYHCECLSPPLTSIPRGLWCCPSCTVMRNGEHYLSPSLLPDFLEVVSTRFRPHSLALASRSSPRTYADQVYQRIHQQHGAARTAPVHRVPGESQHPRRSPVLNRIQRPFRHTSLLTFSNSSSSESSDENVEYTRNTGRRKHCPEVRNRRQTGIQEVKTAVRRLASRFSSLSSSGQQFATFSSFQRNESGTSELFADASDEDSFECSYEDGGVAYAQASAVHHRTNHRVKESLSRNIVSSITEAKTSPAARCPTPSSSSCDILGDILQKQTVLHSPTDFVVIKRDSSLTLKTPSSGQQRPLNPMHHSPVKSSGGHSSTQKSSYVGSSASSSSVSGSSHYYGVCTVQKSTPADHNPGGFDSEQYSAMASRSHYNVNLVDDFKKDSFDASHNKETKPNSDDEVDIYSDIESVGDTETQMDDDMEERLKAYKCEESQINNNDDGTDSSENELVIDEDVHADEENEKLKDDFGDDGISESNQPYLGHNSETREGSEGSVCSDLAESCSDNQENIEEKPNSPGSREEDSRDACSSIPRHGSSQDGFPSSDAEPRADISEEQEDTQNEAECDVQNETDSEDSIRGDNSLGGEADEENSLDSAKGASSDAVSEHTSKVVIDTIASPSEHSRSAEEEDQAGSNFYNDNHFLRHSDDKQMCEDEQDSKSGSEAMEADNDDGVEEGIKPDDDDSMECEDKEHDMNDHEMNVDDEPSESMNKDSSVNIQSEEESDVQNDAESDLGDHEDLENTKAQQYSGLTEDTVKDDPVSEREDENVSDEEFQDQVEDNNNEIQNASEMLLQNEHSVEQKEVSEPGDVENLENSLHSVDDATENPDDFQDQCYDNSDVSGHQFEEARQSEDNKDDVNEHLDSQNSNDLGEREIMTDKVMDQEDNSVDSHNTDLGIEDISDAASDDLNQSEGGADIGATDSKEHCDVSRKQDEIDDVEKNVARLFEQDSNSCSQHKSPTKPSYSKRTVEETVKYHSGSKHSSQSNDEDQEEGEIIEDPPVRKKVEKHDHKLDYGHDDIDDYIDMTPRISISDLPRIPKIKRDRSKTDVPEEIPLEMKRTSVLGRVDLGSSDISWKRLSKHTRERSYRDGRPKDERLLYRERETQSKDKKSGNEDRRAEEKYRDSDRRRDDSKKQDSDKIKDKNQRDHSRERKSDKSKDSYDKSIKSRDWSYGSQEKREREKQHEKSYKERHERERYERDKDRYDRSKDRHEKEKDRYKSEDRYEREKDRDDERFDRDEDRFERIKHEKEKSRDKDRKHKHKDKDRKSETSSKDGSQSKHKRSHSREHFCEKQKEREVRKIDDKLKIVVEHKDPRKDKLEKHGEKKESKHDKKYKDDSHRHHEHRKKDRTSSPYKELAPIESKEIFAKGDSIIINVNFSRSSSKESVISAEDTNGYARDTKKTVTTDLNKVDHASISDDLRTGKLKHGLVEKERNVMEITGSKRPSTPPERMDGRNSQVLSVGESYWQETDDTDIKSPPEDKCHPEKTCSDEDDDDGARSVDAFGGDDHYSDSDDEPVSENQAQSAKTDAESESASGPLEQDVAENSFTKDNESYTVLRRRSPHPPSPPSPPDNDDSYDPCEPTRSPSPPPSSPPPVPPMTLEKPKPPPSPELPPLPPEPEPTDVLVREDPRAQKHSAPCPPPEFLGTSSVSSPVSSQPVLYTSNTMVTTVPLPNIRVPPPNFIPHSVGRNVPAVPPQLMPPRTMNWPVNNPPSMMFPSNQVQQVIRGTFVQAAVQSPSTVSVVSQMGTMLPPGNTIPIVSQVRHMQMNAHPNLSGNTMMSSVPLPPMNMTQMPISSLSQPPGIPNSLLNQHSNVTSVQNAPSSFAVSVQNQGGCRTVASQGQLTSISVSLQSQSQVSSPLPNQTGNHSVSGQSQSRLPPPPPTTALSAAISQKTEKPCKYTSPPNDKTEVVDMDVDSPYSPGDSPSMDSAYDYSPPSSPLAKGESGTKDPFDNLLGAGQKSSRHSEFSIKTSSEKGSKNKSDHLSGSSKKQKVDHRSDSSKVRHSVRLQFTDKGKSTSTFLKEKLSDKRDVLKKLDESQLKILDELPSSAVEMQVKEKFLKKLNRQERVIEEVKLALKPYYTRREINKDEYKDVLRKSVPKICHNKTGEINPVKVKTLVEGYVKKVKYLRKKAGKKSKASKFL